LRYSRRFLSLVVAAIVATALFAATPAGASANDLKLIRTRVSLLGTHYWYEQTYRGLPVVGGFYARHVDRNGKVFLIQDGRKRIVGLTSLAPSVRRSRAESVAAARTGARAGRSSLAVLPGNPARLVWAVTSTSPSSDKRVLVDAHSGRVAAVQNLIREATGSGRVFDPNPVVTLQDESLTDQGDADYAALQPAYQDVALAHLDGSGFLRGDFANIALKQNRAAFSPSLVFSFGRTDDRFEQVMAYFDVTQAQSYIQSLGFTNVNNESQDLITDKYHGDNSFYIPSQDTISLGSGGVDDAEDAEVTWHEYGHAIQDDQSPGFGATNSAGSIGEGFGDYWAFTMSQADSPDTATTPLACIADWDSVSYTSTVPHCLRRVDTDKTMADFDPKGDVHANGEIWSRALHDINQGLGRDDANTIILEAQFQFTPDTSFAAAAQVTVSTAQVLFGSGASAVCRQAFEDRGIL
jgi:Fungalysin/Thermolysin Propeptide Motif/Fungalysin metallopeptidase (M36)